MCSSKPIYFPPPFGFSRSFTSAVPTRDGSSLTPAALRRSARISNQSFRVACWSRSSVAILPARTAPLHCRPRGVPSLQKTKVQPKSNASAACRWFPLVLRWYLFFPPMQYCPPLAASILFHPASAAMQGLVPRQNQISPLTLGPPCALSHICMAWSPHKSRCLPLPLVPHVQGLVPHVQGLVQRRNQISPHTSCGSLPLFAGEGASPPATRYCRRIPLVFFIACTPSCRVPACT